MVAAVTAHSSRFNSESAPDIASCAAQGELAQTTHSWARSLQGSSIERNSIRVASMGRLGEFDRLQFGGRMASAIDYARDAVETV